MTGNVRECVNWWVEVVFILSITRFLVAGKMEEEFLVTEKFKSPVAQRINYFLTTQKSGFLFAQKKRKFWVVKSSAAKLDTGREVPITRWPSICSLVWHSPALRTAHRSAGHLRSHWPLIIHCRSCVYIILYKLYFFSGIYGKHIVNGNYARDKASWLVIVD